MRRITNHTLERRIRRLERTHDEESPVFIRHVVVPSGQELALSLDECFAILCDAGFDTDRVMVFDVPNDLNAVELVRYLREHGAEICSGPKVVAVGPMTHWAGMPSH